MDSYIGNIALFAFNRDIENWAQCNGSILQVNSYQALYSLIGNRYGGNFSKGTFALPKLTAPDSNMGYFICINGIYPSFS
jgi:microcystin-dependent protein